MRRNKARSSQLLQEKTHLQSEARLIKELDDNLAVFISAESELI